MIKESSELAKPAGEEIEGFAIMGKSEEEIKKCEIDEGLPELEKSVLLLSKKNPTQQIAVLINLPSLFKDPAIKAALFPKIINELVVWEEVLQTESASAFVEVIAKQLLTEGEILLLFKKCLSLLRIWSEQVMLGWFNVFKQILATVPSALLQSECVLLAECLSDPSERLLSRKIGCKIICHIGKVFPPQQYVKIYLPYLNKLATDTNWEVRKIIVEDIGLLCDSLGTEISRNSLFDLIIKFQEDEQPEVHLAAIDALCVTLKHFKAPPYFAKCIAKIKTILSNPEAEILKIVMKRIGMILSGISIAELEKDVELSIMLQTLLLVTSQTFFEQEALHLAQNLPAIIMVYGVETFCEDLFVILEKIVSLPSSHEAKLTFAASFHEILKLFGFANGHKKLIEIFFSLLLDSNQGIVNPIIKQLEVVIGVFAQDTSHESAKEFIEKLFKTLPVLFKQIKTMSWRTEAKFIEMLPSLLSYSNAETTNQILLPILQAVLVASQRECKSRACDLLAQLLNDFCPPPLRNEIHLVMKTLATSLSYHDRHTFLCFAQFLVNKMSRHYFKEHFLSLALSLADDRVIGVQMKFCQIAADIKKNLLSEDIKIVDKLYGLIDGISKKALSPALKQIADITLTKLKEIPLTDPSKAEDEEVRVSREREILRAEKRGVEETKKAAIETKLQQMKLESKHNGINLKTLKPGPLMIQGATVKKSLPLPLPEVKSRMVGKQAITKSVTSFIPKPKPQNSKGMMITGEKMLRPKEASVKKK